jgi:hypothetical protein
VGLLWRRTSCCCTAVAQINVNEMLNPVKCLAGSIIFITLSNVKQNKDKDMESISIILIVALMLYTAEKTKKYREL